MEILGWEQGWNNAHPSLGSEEQQESSHHLGKAGMDGMVTKKWLWMPHFKRIKEKEISKPFNPGKKILLMCLLLPKKVNYREAWKMLWSKGQIQVFL